MAHSSTLLAPNAAGALMSWNAARRRPRSRRTRMASAAGDRPALVVKPLGRALFDEAVGDAKLDQPRLDPFGAQQFADGRTEASQHRVVFDGDQAGVAPGGVKKQLAVQRLDKSGR